MADEEDFYHGFISPCFLPECLVVYEIPGVLLNALKLQIVVKQGKMSMLLLLVSSKMGRVTAKVF